MNIIINFNSMIPIYEQLVDQIKLLIRKNELKTNDNLPSVRMLAKDLKISALTVKKAYDLLESEGIVKTIHGKGTYVSFVNKELIREEQIKSLEESIDIIIKKAKMVGISNKEIKDTFLLILEDNTDD
ncbi:MAG: GntR family transcriptional regulator [Bacilli bacterium]|nr:GntR family transcriptional regulator [Bacilli bacterium]